MTNVKRYNVYDGAVIGRISEHKNGYMVIHSDHTREVARLQRARARNLVARLRLLDHSPPRWAWDNEKPYRDKVSNTAYRIAAKYLGESRHA